MPRMPAAAGGGPIATRVPELPRGKKSEGRRGKPLASVGNDSHRVWKDSSHPGRKPEVSSGSAGNRQTNPPEGRGPPHAAGREAGAKSRPTTPVPHSTPATHTSAPVTASGDTASLSSTAPITHEKAGVSWVATPPATAVT